MKRSVCITAALAAALALGAVVGCSGGQSATSSVSSPAASSVAAQTQEELVAEVKGLVANVPEYKSVTITERVVSTMLETENSASAASASAEAASASSASAEVASSETASSEGVISAIDKATEVDEITSTAVYKFDASGPELRTQMDAQVSDIKLQYFSVGDNAVCVTDGPVYSGTIEEFDMTHFKGAQAYLDEQLGDLNVILGCVNNVEKQVNGANTVYILNLDPTAYMNSNEYLAMLADSNPIQEVAFTLTFDKDGYLVAASSKTSFATMATECDLTLSDFDKTEVAEMPQATRTFQEMQADEEQKMDLALNLADEEPAASSASAAAAAE